MYYNILIQFYGINLHFSKMLLNIVYIFVLFYQRTLKIIKSIINKFKKEVSTL